MSPPILFLAGVFLAVVIAGVFTAASHLDAASAAQMRLAAARENLDVLLRRQLVEETGLRGYVATGKRSFLEAEVPRGQSFDVHAANLDAELRSAHLDGALGVLDDLRGLHAQWEQYVKAPLLSDPTRADVLRKQTLGKLLTDGITTDAEAVRAELRAADTSVAKTLRSRINETVALSVGAIALFAVAALVLGLSRAQAVAALVREQSIVMTLQQMLRVDGSQLARTAVGFAYTSATREALVGGDLIDTWRVDEDRGWFLVADVSGKGVVAARHSAFVQFAIRTLTAECLDPAIVLERFNALFLRTFADPSIFVVVFLGTFDARSGEVAYASAGHSIAFVGGRNGIEQLAPTGPIIGLGPDERYERRTLAVVPGETIVLATDGLTECRDENGNMLGDDGVIALLGRMQDAPQAICDRLVAEAQRRTHGEVSDDMAILVLRILAADVASASVPFSTMTS